jgi:catechol 2,3-dioxygenase-like lactoylglutathione lyase family enzyme
MPLTTGVHHVALVTSELDRLIEFYVSVFDAELIADVEEGGLRHAMLHLGGGFALHPFFLDDNPHNSAVAEIFRRGHLDHVAVKVDDAATFATLRRRLVERGASDGTITDFGAARTITYWDPDGWEGEIAQWQARELLTFDERIQEPYPTPEPV